jgi:iron uptake system component EfeO
MGRHLAWQVPVVALALVMAGCSSNDADSGAEATTTTTTTAAAETANPLADKAATEYQAYAVEQTTELVRLVKTFTDAVRAGDLQAAQAAYAPSRVPWERIEPLAGLVEEIDGKVDARVDDFAGVDDAAFTGWHRLEHLLFEKNTTDGGAPFADQLEKDIATLNQQMPTLEVKPVDVAVGAAELIEEVSEGKITGEEDRYSKTDLWDFDANLQGSQARSTSWNLHWCKRIPLFSARSMPDSPRSSTPCGHCVGATAGCSSAQRMTHTRRPAAPG